MSEPVAPLTVTIKGVAHEVVVPDSFALRRELVLLVNQNVYRGGAALIGVCCPSLNIRSASPNMFRAAGLHADIAERIWTELDARGITELDIVTHARTIGNAVEARAYPSPVEVAERTVFTGASAESKS